MPKSTFFNLPEDKRQKIIEAAVDEFSEHPYKEASVNRIVEKAGIAKGSFYQYFEDKKDLYKYIIEISAQQKLMYMQHIMKDFEKLNIFQLIRELYIAGIKYAKDNPKPFSIGVRFLKEKDSELFDEIMEDSRKKSGDFFKHLLIKGIEKGEVDPAIDVDLVSMLITSLSIDISEYYLKTREGEDLMGIYNLVDRMLYIIENGIKAKGKGD
ncbi:TetR/AcrR family transcriptional regulator [Thermovenabulum sp.]|uniref:TetR/AcrR family transcriptional regulator n=1 Tax=Thermovenabulum sp. TaxID=3100335 RepID=UPI003C7A2C8B